MSLTRFLKYNGSIFFETSFFVFKGEFDENKEGVK